MVTREGDPGDTFVNADTLESSTLSLRPMSIEEAPAQDTFPKLNSALPLAELQEQYRGKLESQELLPVRARSQRRYLFPVILLVGILIGMMYANIEIDTKVASAPIPPTGETDASQTTQLSLQSDANVQEVSLQLSDPLAPALEQFLTNTHVPLADGALETPVALPRYYQTNPQLDGLELGQGSATIRLAESDTGSGRYRSSQGEAEWQAGWRLRNPDANIRLAESYKRYLQGAHNHSLSQPGGIRSVRQRPSSLPNSQGGVQHRLLAE